MKKSSMFVIGIVIILLLVGGAYAAWTAQTDFTVNASAGELDVAITRATVGNVSNNVEFARRSISISEDKKSASIGVENLYPGAAVEFKMHVKNTGTIPVKLDRLVHDTIQVIDKETGNNLGRNAEVFANFQAEYGVTIMNGKGKTIDSLNGHNTENQSDWTEDIYKNNKLPSIEPGGKAIVSVKVYLQKEALDIAENKLFRFSITPIFIQG